MGSKHLPLLSNSTLIQDILGDDRLCWLQLKPLKPEHFSKRLLLIYRICLM